VATQGFITLVGSAQTTQATLRGDIARTWHTPYDLLVRPAAAATPLEQAEGLVRPNFVSGLSGGGISRAQLDAPRRVPGVRVAAPVAVAGTANWMIGGFGVDLASQRPRRPLEAYQVQVTSTTDAGLSTGVVATHRLLVASEGVVRYPEFSRDATLSLRGRTIPCPEKQVSCFAPTVCEHGGCGPPQDGPTPSWGVELLQPIVVAGVDPDAEAALAGLDRCVVAGRYLTGGDRPREVADRDPPGELIPALVSGRSFVDETLTARLARAGDPLALLAGIPPGRLGGWRAVRRSSTTIDRLYRSYLRRLG
jgi:putative ABC transport system permease protein